MFSQRNYTVEVGNIIKSASSDYVVQHILGSGSFGDVAECRKVATDRTVALKILCNRKSIQDGKLEETILKLMKPLGSERFNIVAWKDSFCFEGVYCLEFEKLDISLLEFLNRWHDRSLPLNRIRPIIHQLANALNFLKHAGIVHADLKPENIMMVDHLNQPLRVKVIDFGLSIKNPEAHVGRVLQTLQYRCPEVLLGASFNEAIDVWSLGCIAVEMFMGAPLFPCSDEYAMIRNIVRTIGKPPDQLLEAGEYTRWFFKKDYGGEDPNLWTLMSETELGHCKTNINTISCLDDLKTRGWKIKGEEKDADDCDRRNFFHLISQMLKVDPAERIKPSQIFLHPFITLSHLDHKFKSTHLMQSSLRHMQDLQSKIMDNGERAQLDPSTCLTEGSSSVGQFNGSKTRKRPRDTDDNEDCKIPSKRRKTECLDTSADRRISPSMSWRQKRKRDDADPCRSSEGGPPVLDLREIITHCDKEKLIKCRHLSPAKEDASKKRKRSNEEASDSDRADSKKTKKRKVEGEVENMVSNVPDTISPLMSRQQKRKRDDADPSRSSDGGPPFKKGRVLDFREITHCDEEKLIKCGHLSPAKEDASKKRRRSNEEASDSDRADLKKTKNRKVEGEVETTASSVPTQYDTIRYNMARHNTI